MNTINKDITTVESGYIIHCVNCQNVMGSGLAKALYTKWPPVKREYHEFCNRVIKQNPILGNLALLGEYNVVEVADDLYVVNLFGQYTYGSIGKHAEYSAIIKALINFSEIYWGAAHKFYIPYNFCSFRAGGDWSVILKILENTIPKVTICKYE